MTHFTPPDLSRTANWHYRGEGNANIVLALPGQQKVLRIRKIKPPQSIVHWLLNLIINNRFVRLLFSWTVRNGNDKDELRDLMFYRGIMRPLLGYDMVCNARQVRLTPQSIAALQRDLSGGCCRRPVQRQRGGRSSLTVQNRATIFDDYAFLPPELLVAVGGVASNNDTFAVEIKPKQGWAPPNERQRSDKCSFCMKQYLKLKDGQIDRISSYCPEDLFSGDETRMLTAIKALIDEPQNNFKLFKNGDLFYGAPDNTSNNIKLVLSHFFQQNLLDKSIQDDDDSLLDEFISLIHKSLTTKCARNDDNEMGRKCFGKCNETNTTVIWNGLPEDSVLDRILQLQQFNLYGNEFNYNKLKANKYTDSRNDYSYVEKLINKVNTNDSCMKCLIMDLINENNDLYFVPYLISSIAKDCSIMLTFRRIITDNVNYNSNNVINTRFGSFIYRIGIVDLYPKPLSTITTFRKKIEDMLICSATGKLINNKN